MKIFTIIPRFFIKNSFLCFIKDSDRELFVQFRNSKLPGANDQDERRERYIEKQGIQILRFTNTEIKEGLEWVVEAITKRFTPSTSPSAEGEKSGN